MKYSKLKNGNETNKKIRFFIYFMAILFFIYIFRLAYLQIFDVNMYRVKGDKQIITKEIVLQDRGTIYDRNKKPLAANLQYNTAYISKAITKNQKEKLKEEELYISKKNRSKMYLLEKYEAKTSLPEYSQDEVEKVASILEIDEKTILDNLKKGVSGPIAFKVDEKKKKAVEDLNLGYISFYNESERYYPGKDIGAPLIGFTEGGKGRYGLEKQYDQILSGKNGYAEFYKAVGGTRLPFEASKRIDGTKAKSIVTTIDEEVQKFVHDKLMDLFTESKPMYATAIVSDPNTGEILAMESLPSFNANDPRSLNSDIDKLFLQYLEEDKVDNYVVDRWNNYNISSIYEPGSTFKSITASIALDSNRTIEQNSYNCTGRVEISPGVWISCWRPQEPHGHQNIMEAFSNSCNPAFVGIINDIGKEEFANYGNAFKFGQKTGIDLPNEVAGRFPTDENISDVDFRPMAYGHSLSTTPIQELAALNATINGGVYYRPHLLKSIVDENGKEISKYAPEGVARVISEQTSETMRKYYENNSKNSIYYEQDELRIGNKTGTTVVKNSKNIFDDSEPTDPDEPINYNIISNFAMYPSNAPKYSLLVLMAYPVENSNSGYLSSFILDVFNKMEVTDINKSSANVTEKELIKVADLKGLSIIEAKDQLRKKGLSLAYDRNNMTDYNIITEQSPISDGYIEQGANITVISVDPEEIVVPKLVGMNTEEAIKLLNENKLKFEIIGQGDKIIEQKPLAMSKLNKDEKIKITTSK